MDIKFTYDLTEMFLTENIIKHLGVSYIFSKISLKDSKEIRIFLDKSMINSKTFTGLDIHGLNSNTLETDVLEFIIKGENESRYFHVLLFDIKDDYYIISTNYRYSNTKYGFITIKIDGLDDLLQLLELIIYEFELSNNDCLGNFLIDNLKTNGYQIYI